MLIKCYNKNESEPPKDLRAQQFYTVRGLIGCQFVRIRWIKAHNTTVLKVFFSISEIHKFL